MNNAGVFVCALRQFSEQEFLRQFNTNVLGTFLDREPLCRPSGRKEAASTSDRRPVSPALSIYVASRGAVNGLTRALKEFGPRKIRANTLNPGGTRNGGVRGRRLESKKQIIASTPLGHISQPENIARVAVFRLG